MAEKVQRDFDKVAASWDEKPQRRQIAAAVTAGIQASIHLHRRWQVLEYGCGTGLCGLQIASEVGHLTAADTSSGMLEELKKKSLLLGLENVTPVLITPDHWKPQTEAFDLIFSSMVLHHIEETEVLLKNLHCALKPGGFLALADLEPEDGTFHDDSTGVAHFGFNPQALIATLERLGFVALNAQTVHTVHKQRGDDTTSYYPVFLITGQKTC